METFYYTASSLDGFIADGNNSLDWLFQFGDPETGYFTTFMNEVGALAMGSTTYEWILNHSGPNENGETTAWAYTQPAWVFTSRTLPVVPGADITFVRGDVEPVHQAMCEAAGDRKVWIVGGGDLAGQFHDKGLLDEIVVSIASVTLRNGAPLFPRTITTPPLKLISANRINDGFVDLHYEVQRSYSK